MDTNHSNKIDLYVNLWNESQITDDDLDSLMFALDQNFSKKYLEV